MPLLKKPKPPKKTSNKGSKWLTPTQRADIALAREMRTITGKTNQDIADEFGITHATATHITSGNLPSEAKKIYKKKKARLDELAFQTTVAALTKGQELIMQADDPRHLSGVAAMGKLSDTVYRLETQQPTEIHQALPAESHALEFIKMLMQKMDLSTALDAFTRASLDPLVPEVRKQEIRRRIESGELKLLPA